MCLTSSCWNQLDDVELRCNSQKSLGFRGHYPAGSVIHYAESKTNQDRRPFNCYRSFCNYSKVRSAVPYSPRICRTPFDVTCARMHMAGKEGH
jgi:hypothetical protein